MQMIVKSILTFTLVLSLIGCASMRASMQQQEQAMLAGKIGCSADNVSVDHNSEKTYNDTLGIKSVKNVNVMCSKKRYVCSKTEPGITTSLLGTTHLKDSYRTEMTCSAIA